MASDERERIRHALQEWHERKIPPLHARNINLDLVTKTDHILDVIGVRRAGKTSILFLIAQSLGKGSAVYVNFEERTLYPLDARLLDALMAEIKSAGKRYLLLDEIQNVRGWERWAREVYDANKGHVKIVVSGSSSRLIRKDIATILTGRHIPVKVFPLSFSEFVGFRNAGKPAGLIDEYLGYGGFPEVVLFKNASLKREVLSAYYDDIIYKDVLGKYALQEKTVLENFVKYLFINIAGLFSYRRGKEYLDSLGIPTSTRTLLKYTSILEEVFLFFFVPIFARKVREQAKYPKKVYAVDIGLRNTVHPGEDFGKKAENLVYLELLRRGGDINYWKSREGNEVDFIVRDGPKVSDIIQVAWDMNDELTRAREITALVLAAEEFGMTEGIIVTNAEEQAFITSGVNISVIPLWKFLLGKR